jgi:hypothetical protein
MRWTVVWTNIAQNRLATTWNNAPDKAAVAAAADRIDVKLARDPYADSEERTAPSRVMFEPPLAVGYDVSDDDRLVTVWGVWRP